MEIFEATSGLRACPLKTSLESRDWRRRLLCTPTCCYRRLKIGADAGRCVCLLAPVGSTLGNFAAAASPTNFEASSVYYCAGSSQLAASKFKAVISCVSPTADSPDGKVSATLKRSHYYHEFMMYVHAVQLRSYCEGIFRLGDPVVHRSSLKQEENPSNFYDGIELPSISASQRV